MKQGAKIIVAILVSILLVWMGTGIVSVHCNHSNTTTIATVSDMSGNSCSAKSDCMQTNVIKLSPASIDQSIVPDFNAPLLYVPSFLLPQIPEVWYGVADVMEHCTKLWFHHPREYLSMIRILII